MTKSIGIRNQHFVLHASGGLFWDEMETLLISDVHLGKISHFRKSGSPVPEKAIQENFRKLDEVLTYFAPKRIIFLGDLFHSYLNQEWVIFENWMQKTFSEIVLVEGNHDVISPLKYNALGIKIFPELQIKDFLLTHHPEERREKFNLSGHLHPGVRITGPGRQILDLPCFFKSTNQMILPAFGEFTGKHLLVPRSGDEVYFITPGVVIPFIP